MAYSPAGFIWNNALEHGKSLRDFGEFTLSHKRWKNGAHKSEPHFLDCYREFVNGTSNIMMWSEPSVEWLRPFVATNTVGWDLDIPDVLRAANFIRDLMQFESRDGGRHFPDFVILWLPNDHTSGARFGSPTPEAQVADNDLAFGQVIETVSHSTFWKDTCILAIEDDSQNGWDHVSGYRTTAYVVSPYTRRKAVVGTQYNQTSVLRTMELILDLPPMNQMDATATPMFDCFTNTPDFTEFNAVTNNVPLDRMNKSAKETSDRQLRRDAVVSGKLQFQKEDQCPEDVLNRILWRATKGPRMPYPAWASKRVDDD